MDRIKLIEPLARVAKDEGSSSTRTQVFRLVPVDPVRVSSLPDAGASCNVGLFFLHQ